LLGLPSHMSGFLHELGPPSSGVYSYVAYPTVLPGAGGTPVRPRYRNESASNSSSGVSSSGPMNIMADRRVVRGNTYARNSSNPLRKWSVTATENGEMATAKRRGDRNGYVRRRVLPSLNNGHLNTVNGGGGVDDQLRADRLLSSEARYQAARARAKKRLAHYEKESNMPPRSANRRNLTIQTDNWLEEIKDRSTETEAAVQTEPEPVSASDERALSRASTVDKSTQVASDDPDLFHFDVEVGVLLEALVSRTLEESLLEVIDEEEEVVLTANTAKS